MDETQENSEMRQLQFKLENGLNLYESFCQIIGHSDTESWEGKISMGEQMLIYSSVKKNRISKHIQKESCKSEMKGLQMLCSAVIIECCLGNIDIIPLPQFLKDELFIFSYHWINLHHILLN